MLSLELSEPLDRLVAAFASFLDRRHGELLEPLFLGTLLAYGRRTATAWFQAGGLAEHFRRGYTLLGTLGRSYIHTFAGLLFSRLRRDLDPGPRWLFALDDTPTQRYGPCVEGAGLHHHPSPGPAGPQYLHGHVWVTLGWVVSHPVWHTQTLPQLADLYIRQADLPKIEATHRPAFATKLQQAAGQIAWIAEQLHGTARHYRSGSSPMAPTPSDRC